MKVSEDLKLPVRPIQMVDLRKQFEGIESEVMQSFREILDATAFINGPAVRQFQQELEDYLGVRRVVPCGNGTDALQIALMALELQPGDEVIVPSFTFVASIEVIALLRLIPVVVDVDPRTFNMNVEDLSGVLTEKTRAILPVHLFGQCADMEAIMQFARDNDLYVIEDNAQSIGATYTFDDGREVMSGTIGDIGCLSFYPSKNLGAYGDGGAVMSNDADLGEMLHSIANHGMARIRYHHDRVGVNSRLDSFQAAVLSAKLRRLDDYVAARQAAAAYYDKNLSDIESLVLPKRDPKSTHVFHQYTIQITDSRRDELKQYLQDKGVPTMIYYPVPLQEQEAFKGVVRIPGSLQTTDLLCRQVLSLPMHSEMDDDQLEYICATIESFFA